MKKVVSLYLPAWPTDRLRRQRSGAQLPNAPLILVGRDGSRRIVTAADSNAYRLGIKPGMVAAKAQALVADLHIVDADPIADSEALVRLAHWALKLYAPLVATDADGLFIDVTGATHRFGGDAGILADFKQRMEFAGIAARVAMAPTYGAAHALARFRRGDIPIVDDGGLIDALADLPIEALRLPTEVSAGLRALGFDHIGPLNATPRAPLALRFGSVIGGRLDQAYGRMTEPMALAEIPGVVSVTRRYAEPIAAPETIARYIRLMVEDLASALEAKGLGAVRLDLIFHRVDSRFEAIRAGLARPTRDTKRLARLLCDRIEKIDPGFGIERMSLSAPIAEPLDYRQAATALGEEPEPDIAELVDTLTNRLGPGQLYQCGSVESDVPERSVIKRLGLNELPSDWPLRWPRPSRLLARPEPIETIALLPDHPPVSFTWRGVRRRIKQADGPERIFGEWWKSDAELDAVRDYFQVEDESGERFWLFRAGDGESDSTGAQNWFLHGIFA